MHVNSFSIMSEFLSMLVFVLCMCGSVFSYFVSPPVSFPLEHDVSSRQPFS